MPQSLDDYGAMDTRSIIDMVLASPTITKCGAICEIVKRNIHTSEVNSILHSLKSDETPFWNRYKVRDFAIAALHLLRFEEYVGTKEEIKNLISVKLDFSHGSTVEKTA